MIHLKSDDELARMRHAGQVVAEALEAMSAHVAPGVATREFDEIARDVIGRHGASASFLHYPPAAPGGRPFPASVTVSVNDEIVHGIPGERQLEAGDIVSLDCGAAWQGYHADAAVTVAVGLISPAAQDLLAATRGALEAAIGAIRPGAWLWDVMRIIQSFAEARGFGVVREYQGHGIGREMHEPPSIPNFLGHPRPPNVRFRPGLTMAIEPMITAGDWHTSPRPDGWTVATRDGSLSAHFEHTIAVTPIGAEVLTKRR